MVRTMRGVRLSLTKSMGPPSAAAAGTSRIGSGVIRHHLPGGNTDEPVDRRSDCLPGHSGGFEMGIWLLK